MSGTSTRCRRVRPCTEIGKVGDGSLSHDKPPNMQPTERPPGEHTALEGDIVVTAVGEHYVIGRLTEDRGTQEPLGWQRDRATALETAFAMAGANHRVILCGRAGQSPSRRR